MRSKWTRGATLNLGKIVDYIHHENSLAASKFLAQVQKKVALIEEYPLAGSVGPLVSVRTMVISTNYALHYRVKDEEVQILRVLHTKRQFP